MQTYNTVDNFSILYDNYFDTIDAIISQSIQNNLLPFKLLLFMPKIKDYISNNKIIILEQSLTYYTKHKTLIKTASFDENMLDDISSINNQYSSNIDIFEVIEDIYMRSKEFDNISIINYINRLMDILDNIIALY